MQTGTPPVFLGYTCPLKEVFVSALYQGAFLGESREATWRAELGARFPRAACQSLHSIKRAFHPWSQAPTWPAFPPQREKPASVCWARG